MSNDVMLTDVEKSAIRALCEDIGVSAAARQLMVGRETLARCVADLRVHRGTIIAIRASLASVSR